MQKTEAVILRRQEIRETSLILVVFTRNLGKIHGLAKGVRGVPSAVPWYLEPMTLQALVVYERKRSSMSLVSGFDLVDAFDPIRRDLERVAYGSLCLELVDQMTEIRDPQPAVFDLLVASLRGLAQGGDPKSIVRFFETHILRMGGVLPDVQSGLFSPLARTGLQRILQTPLSELSHFRLELAQERELRGPLLRLSRGVLDRDLKSRQFLFAINLERPVEGAARAPAVPMAQVG